MDGVRRPVARRRGRRFHAGVSRGQERVARRVCRPETRASRFLVDLVRALQRSRSRDQRDPVAAVGPAADTGHRFHGEQGTGNGVREGEKRVLSRAARPEREGGAPIPCPGNTDLRGTRQEGRNRLFRQRPSPLAGTVPLTRGSRRAFAAAADAGGIRFPRDYFVLPAGIGAPPSTTCIVKGGSWSGRT